MRYTFGIAHLHVRARLFVVMLSLGAVVSFSHDNALVLLHVPSLVRMRASQRIHAGSGLLQKMQPKLTPSRPSSMKHMRTPRSALSMGLLDNLGSFLRNREGDFAKLESSDDSLFGPGPAILLYGCPPGLADEEIRDMIVDGAPEACKMARGTGEGGGVVFRRIGEGGEGANALLDRSVSDVLEQVVQQGSTNRSSDGSVSEGAVGTNHQPPCPVIYFSGISNSEMMATYRIISTEIYEETGGMANAACAKAVPPAMEKTLRQVIEEITGDHLDAITPQSDDE